MQIALSYPAHAQLIDPPDDPIGKALFESLNCSNGHHNPERAFWELFTELSNANPRMFNTPGFTDAPLSRNRLSSLPADMSLVARNSWCWYNTMTLDVIVPNPIECGIDLNKNWTAGAVWLNHRSHYNLLVEEASHWWVEKVGVETALKQTPRYAAYLAETGVPFDKAFLGLYTRETTLMIRVVISANMRELRRALMRAVLNWMMNYH
jgi:hypothetical protein